MSHLSKRGKTILGLAFALATSAAPASAQTFSDIAPGPARVYTSTETASLLTPAEKKLLEQARSVTLIMTPEESIVGDAQSVEDFKASRQRLGDFLAKIVPDSVFSSFEQLQILSSLRDVVKHPGQAYHLMPAGRPDILVISNHPENGTQENSWYELSDKYVRPEKLRVIRTFERLVSIAHELGHDGQSDTKPPDNFGLGYAADLADETTADRRGLDMLKGLSKKLFPSKKQSLAVYLDQRAIDSTLHLVNSVYVYGGETYTQDEEGNSVLLDDPLFLNDHALIGVLKHNADPLAALVASSLANRPVNRLLREGPALARLKTDDPGRYAELEDMRRNDRENYQHVLEDVANEYALQNPLHHYAAVKALLAEHGYAKDSLARVYAREYIGAMERMVKPDMLKAARAATEEFRRIIQKAPDLFKVSREQEKQLALNIAQDPRNQPAPKQP